MPPWCLWLLNPLRPGAVQQPAGLIASHRLLIPVVDLDLARVRAFVAAASAGHFGRGAAELGISQQALSKRITRLEDDLGVRLFLRTGRSVSLTEAGHRFVAPAQAAVAAGDRAVTAARDPGRPLRLDVWGHLYDPMRTILPVLEGQDAEVGHGRDLPSVTGALARGEIDAGFGRFDAGATDAADAGLSHRLVRLEPVDAVMSAGHSLAGADELRPADLRKSVLWCPAQLSRLEFLRRFAAEFGIKTETGANLGLDHLLGELSADPRRFTLLPAELPLSRRDIRMIPLAQPTPLYAWSLAWREADQHPSMPALLRAFADLGRANRWLEYNPERDWLPGTAPASG